MSIDFNGNFVWTYGVTAECKIWFFILGLCSFSGLVSHPKDALTTALLIS